MKTICLTLLFALTAALPLNAIPGNQRVIDEQVWDPFTRAILAHDLDGFFAVHSPEVIRVEGRARRVSGLEAYRTALQTHWSRPPAAGETFELRFTLRLSNGLSAFETGYFRGQVRQPDGKLRTHYGSFAVTLRREGERWKILVDADSLDGRTVTEEMFQAAQPLTTVPRFGALPRPAAPGAARRNLRSRAGIRLRPARRLRRVFARRALLLFHPDRTGRCLCHAGHARDRPRLDRSRAREFCRPRQHGRCRHHPRRPPAVLHLQPAARDAAVERPRVGGRPCG